MEWHFLDKGHQRVSLQVFMPGCALSVGEGDLPPRPAKVLAEAQLQQHVQQRPVGRNGCSDWGGCDRLDEGMDLPAWHSSCASALRRAPEQRDEGLPGQHRSWACPFSEMNF